MHKRYKNSMRKIVEMAQGRKIIFYGIDELTKYVYRDLRDLGYDIEYFVSEESCGAEIEGKAVKNKYELLYEEKGAVFIVGFVFRDHGTIFNSLTELGFEFERDFYLCGLGGYSKKYDAFDSLLGHNRFYDGLLGFEVYGEKRENSYSIVLLGGSTTDPTVGNIPKCWGKILYEKIREIKPEVVLYNGGMGGYSSNQEFYKLIRDGLKLNPSMVISFDGFNDVNFWVVDKVYPHLSKYEMKVYNNIVEKGGFAPDTLDLRNASEIVHGFANTNDDAGEWCASIKKMHGICEEFGIEYISCLQPMIALGAPVIQEEQKRMLEAAYISVPAFKDVVERIPFFYAGVKDFVEQNAYIYDLTDIFNGKSDMYYDFCHNTQYGHEVIADQIFEIIKSKII